MEERIKNYLKYIDDILEKNEQNKINHKDDYDRLIENHLLHISFYQHERLVHLIVTVLFAVLAFMTVGIAIVGNYLYMLFVTIALMVLLIPYIKHYYFLENSVQKMYDQYDALDELKNNKNKE